MNNNFMIHVFQFINSAIDYTVKYLPPKLSLFSNLCQIAVPIQMDKLHSLYGEFIFHVQVCS